MACRSAVGGRRVSFSRYLFRISVSSRHAPPHSPNAPLVVVKHHGRHMLATAMVLHRRVVSLRGMLRFQNVGARSV